MALTSKELMEDLAKPFNENEISWRAQTVAVKNNTHTALVVPYITSRTVMNKLDEVCGALWKSEYRLLEINGIQTFQCSISIYIDGQWITRTDGSEVSDVQSVKGGYSDSLKRAAVQWGIGRYIYNLPTYWVDVKTYGDMRINGKFKVKGRMENIMGYFDRPKINSNQYSQQNQSPKKQKQQTTHINQQQNASQSKALDADTMKEALSLVIGQLQFFEMPLKHVESLLKRVGATETERTIETASIETLRKLFKAMKPVVSYIKTATEQCGLTLQEALDAAQSRLREKINQPTNLIFKIDQAIANEILNSIKHERNIA